MVGRAARRQARRKNICTGTAVIHCLLNPGQAQYCKLFFFFFFNNNRFCRNDLSYWKDKRGALFCSHEPLVWLSIAPNVIITGGINYLSVTSHNFQICFKTGSCSVPGNKSVLGNKREEQSLCNITSADRHLQKNPPAGAQWQSCGGPAGYTSVVGFTQVKISECLFRNTVISLYRPQETSNQVNKKDTNYITRTSRNIIICKVLWDRLEKMLQKCKVLTITAI